MNLQKKLKDRQDEIKKDAVNLTSQTKDQESPSDKCITCHHPVGHHLLECDKETLQQTLKETLHEIPVKPLNRPTQNSASIFSNQTLNSADATPCTCLIQITVKLNKVTKMKTSPVSNRAKLLAVMTTQPRVIL